MKMLGDVVKQGFYGETVPNKSVPKECLSSGSVFQRCLSRRRACYKSVLQASLTRACDKSVRWKCFDESASQECPTGVVPLALLLSRSWHLGPHLSCCMNEYSAHFGIPMNTFSTFLKPYIWSVVSNIFICPFHIWDVILPIDFHIFQDG